MNAMARNSPPRASSNLVVRTHAPARRVLTVIALTLLAAFALYVVYELGRYDAGYDRLAVSQERAEHEVSIDRLEKANRELRTRLAELDTIRVGRAQERSPRQSLRSASRLPDRDPCAPGIRYRCHARRHRLREP